MYLLSKNKGADQLRGDVRAAYLRLSFRIMQKSHDVAKSMSYCHIFVLLASEMIGQTFFFSLQYGIVFYHCDIKMRVIS